MPDVLETPQKIVKWQEKFGLQAKTLSSKTQDEAHQLADEVAKLLNELQLLPGFDTLKEKFRGLAKSWQEGTELLEQHKKGKGTQDERKEDRKKLRQVLADLQQLRDEIKTHQTQKPQDVKKLLEDELVDRASAQQTLADKAHGLGDHRADLSRVEALQLRLDQLTKTAQAAIDDEDVLGQRLAYTELGKLEADQAATLKSLTDDKYSARTWATLTGQINELSTRIAKNLEYAQKDPTRDEAALGKCKQELAAERKAADKVLKKNNTKDNRTKLYDHVARFKEIEQQSLGLMGSQARGLLAAEDTAVVQKECDVRFNTLQTRMETVKSQIERVRTVDSTFDATDVEKSLFTAKGAADTAKLNTYQRIFQVKKGNPDPALRETMRKDFAVVESLVQDAMVEVRHALDDLDQKVLKLADIKDVYQKALTTVPEDSGVPGRKELKSRYDAAKNEQNVRKAIVMLDEVEALAEKILEKHAEGLANGNDYWDKRKEAQEKLSAELQHYKNVKANLSGEQQKLAKSRLDEALLYIDRDQIPDYIQAIKILDDTKKSLEFAEKHDPTERRNARAVWQKKMLELDPYYIAAKNLEVAEGTDKLQKEHAKIETDASGASYDKSILDRVKQLQKDCSQKVRVAYQKWEVSLKEAREKVKFLERLRDNKVAPEDDPQRAQAAALLKNYAKALDAAGHGDYPQGTALLQTVTSSAATLEAGVKGQRDAALKELDDAPAWTGPTSSVKDKKYGFNTTRDAMRYTSGQQMNPDGTLIMSKELDDISKALDARVKVFRKLCATGEDPIAVARKVFDGIPENFWPPDAMRIIAAFRAAEATFEEEELRKEAEDLLRAPEKIKDVQELREAIEKAKSQGPKKFDGKTLETLKDVGLGSMDRINELGEVLGVYGALKDVSDWSDGVKSGMEGSGKAGSGLGGSISALKACKNVYDLQKFARQEWAEKHKEDFKAREEDQVVSPVKAKILEYERNRAIAQLANNIVDSGLKFAGVGGANPVVEVIADLKGLILALIEAGRYFAMLAGTKSDQRSSKKDPDSITYLGLARQAKDEGIAGGRKCFEAACNLANVVGDSLELGGVTAIAGFCVKGSSKTLEYGGKVVFTVWDWKDASNQKKCIERAKQQPPDYQAIAEVFSNTRKYSRFLIAYGCLNGDPWARSWALGRGLTDRDLDNPQTSTLIIREYIGATQEGLLGDTQDEEPETFWESLPGRGLKKVGRGGKFVGEKISDKVAGRNRSIENNYFEIKNATLTVVEWNAHKDRAVTSGGLYDGSTVRSIGKVFDALEKSRNEFQALPKTSAADDADETFRETARAYYLALDSLRKVLAGYEPLDNRKEPHECMKLYLADLLMAVGDEQQTLSAVQDAFEESVWLRKGNGDQAKAAELKQKEIDKQAKDRRKAVATYESERANYTRELLEKKKFKTTHGSHGIIDDGPEKIAADALKALELDPSELDDLKSAVETICADVVRSLNERLDGVEPDESAGDGKLALDKKAYEKEFKVQCAAAEKELNDRLQAEFTNRVAGPVGAYTWNQNGSVPTPLDNFADFDAIKTNAANDWKKIVADASHETTGGWVGKDTVSKPLANFIEVNANLQASLLAEARAIELQGKWRIANDTLQAALENLDVRTKFKTDHPGMVDLRDRFLAKLEENEDQSIGVMREVNQSMDWEPPQAYLDRYGLEPKRYKQFEGLCEKRFHMDKKTAPSKAETLLSSYVKRNAEWEKALKDPSKVKKADADKLKKEVVDTLGELKKAFTDCQPKNGKKHSVPGQPHIAMTSYCTHMAKLIGDIASGRVKEIELAHAVATFKA